MTKQYKKFGQKQYLSYYKPTYTINVNEIFFRI